MFNYFSLPLTHSLTYLLTYHFLVYWNSCALDLLFCYHDISSDFQIQMIHQIKATMIFMLFVFILWQTCIYAIQSNPSHLHNSQWIILLIQSCLFLPSFRVNNLFTYKMIQSCLNSAMFEVAILLIYSNNIKTCLYLKKKKKKTVYIFKKICHPIYYGGNNAFNTNWFC